MGRCGARETVPAQLTAYLDAAGIDSLLFANLDAASVGERAQNVEEQDANLAALLAHRQDARLLPAYWVRVGRFDSNVYAFAGAMDAEPFAAAFFAPVLNGYEADSELLDPYLSVLSKNHRPAVILLSGDDRDDALRLYRVAQRHPSVAIVFCYDARGPHMRDALDTAERAAQRRDARLYWAASHATAGEISDAVKRLGDDHVLFASDALEGEDHAESARTLLEELEAGLSPGEFKQVTAGNARRLLRLTE
jgi:predicted TIM-barrel fold metal-dependent hydrolase